LQVTCFQDRTVQPLRHLSAREDTNAHPSGRCSVDDGVTFVHVAQLPDDDNPLGALPEFAEFQREILDRCVEPPAPSRATVVGSYRGGA
jgi:hypothetical protein